MCFWRHPSALQSIPPTNAAPERPDQVGLASAGVCGGERGAGPKGGVIKGLRRGAGAQERGGARRRRRSERGESVGLGHGAD